MSTEHNHHVYPGYGTQHGGGGESTLRIVWIYPDLLSTYGDRGNLLILARRAQLRGMPVEILEVRSDQPLPTAADIYLIGGGEDAFIALFGARDAGELAGIGAIGVPIQARRAIR